MLSVAVNDLGGGMYVHYHILSILEVGDFWLLYWFFFFLKILKWIEETKLSRVFKYHLEPEPWMKV